VAGLAGFRPQRLEGLHQVGQGLLLAGGAGRAALVSVAGELRRVLVKGLLDPGFACRGVGGEGTGAWREKRQGQQEGRYDAHAACLFYPGAGWLSSP